MARHLESIGQTSSGTPEVPDAWDHVYSLPPEDRYYAFQLVRQNIGRGIIRGVEFLIPDDPPEMTVPVRDLIAAAERTTIELERKNNGEDI